MKEHEQTNEPIDFLTERNKRLGIRLLPPLLPREMPPVERTEPIPLPAPKPQVPMEQRLMESWDNLMCCGKEYELEDQSEQVSDRLWEKQLPAESYGE